MKFPECKNECHPPDCSRDSMIYIETQGNPPTHHVFACTACRDRRRILSVQVISDPRFQQHVRNLPAVRKAHSIRRGVHGKITYFR